MKLLEGNLAKVFKFAVKNKKQNSYWIYFILFRHNKEKKILSNSLDSFACTWFDLLFDIRIIRYKLYCRKR